MRMSSNKMIAGIAFGAVLVTGTGIAYAYWTTTGEGTGAATVAADNGELNLKSVAIASIVPGENETFAIRAWNAGTTDLRVEEVVTTVTSSDSACQAVLDTVDTVEDFTVDDVDTSGVNVPAGTAETSPVTIGTGTLEYHNDPVTNQDDCKGAAIVLTFAAGNAA